MKRFPRWLLGLAAAVAVHLVAWVVVQPVVKLKAPVWAGASNPPPPVMTVQLVRLRERQGHPAPQPAERASAPADPLPPPPEVFAASASDPLPTTLPASGPPLDDDPLYRAPFRDAVAQARARLRAGLGCAHVDLQQLPAALVDLCATAARLRDRG